MGRRFPNHLLATASAVLGFALLAAGTARARLDEPATPPAPPAASPGGTERALVLPAASRTKTKHKSPAAERPGARPLELPAEFQAAASAPEKPPANLGPEPTPYSSPEEELGAPGAAPPPAPSKKRDAPKQETPAPAPASDLADTPPADRLPAVPSLPEPPSTEPPGILPPPATASADAALDKTKDPEVQRVQTPALGTPAPRPAKPPGAAAPVLPPPPASAEGTPLPPAVEKPGLPASGAGVAKEPETPFVVAPEKLPLGKQAIGLTVEVIAPQFLNVKQTAALKVVVRNTGTSDARGVVVRDSLPPNLTFVSSQPETTPVGSVLSWNLGDVPAGTERLISLSVQPTATGAFDHSATVTMAAGARSRTVVREPKLKIEMTSNSGKILRGQPVTFKIAVTNPGDGPARNITVQAKLSAGLREASGEPNDQNLFEQTIPVIGPGEVETLDALVFDTVLGGDQTCMVAASSPDVVAGAAEARVVSTVTVVEPKLTIKVTGPDKRFTDQLASYQVTMTNPGTSPARNVKVVATLPVSGRVQSPLPPGARFDAQTRKLTWSRPQLDSGESAAASFQIRMGGVGLYQVAAEAKAEGVPLAKDILPTNVEGMTDVNMNVSEKRHVLDVDDATVFVIKLTNSGTKEATGLSLSAVLSENAEPINTSGTDEVATYNSAEHRLLFAQIPRLGPGKSIELGIKVKATKHGTGLATCRVFLTHNELSEKLEDVAAFKIAPPTRR